VFISNPTSASLSKVLAHKHEWLWESLWRKFSWGVLIQGPRGDGDQSTPQAFNTFEGPRLECPSSHWPL